jgi:hypothetical protein
MLGLETTWNLMARTTHACAFIEKKSTIAGFTGEKNQLLQTLFKP